MTTEALAMFATIGGGVWHRMRFLVSLLPLIYIVAGGDASACNEAGIREVLLRYGNGDLIKQLEFIRARRAFKDCDFSFRYSYDVNLYFTIKTTWVNEVHFYADRDLICFESRPVQNAGYDGDKRREFVAVEGPKAKHCISSTEPQKPARGQLSDWFRKTLDPG